MPQRDDADQPTSDKRCRTANSFLAGTFPVKRDTAIDAYLNAAQTWDVDRTARAERAERRAYGVAAAFGACAALSLLALVALLPLKRVEPFVIRVDSSSGITDVVPLYSGTASINEAVTRYLVNAYTLARERYNAPMAEPDYSIAGAMQSPAMNTAWLAAWDRANPESPLNRYKDGTTVRAQIKAISFLQRADGTQDLAQVRFLTATRKGGVGAEHLQHYIATLQYTYVRPSQDDALRALNPLGFRVVSYRREPELLEAPPNSTVSSTGE